VNDGDSPEERKADLRDAIFRHMECKRVKAVISSGQSGVVSGIGHMLETAAEIGVTIRLLVEEGEEVDEGGDIAVVEGTPKQICQSEDLLLGTIGKTSGIATAARRAVRLAGGRVRVVSGGWKKMPRRMKEEIREAIAVGGCGVRIAEEPFVYLDKNYVRMLGGISKSLLSVREIEGRIRVIQVRGETERIAREAVIAAENGADIIMVDTGDLSDLRGVSTALSVEGLRQKVTIAFGGSILLEEIPEIIKEDVDILDIGRAIIDAPMLEVRFDVERVIP